MIKNVFRISITGLQDYRDTGGSRNDLLEIAFILMDRGHKITVQQELEDGPPNILEVFDDKKVFSDWMNKFWPTS